MRRLIIFVGIILLLWLTACSRSADALPTQIPAAEEGNGASNSPRPTDNPADLLPPTWTPQPTPTGGSLPTSGAAENAGTPTANQTLYLVQAGDTLGTIAIEFGVTVDDLARLNNISNLDHIETGQMLLIP